MQRSKLIPILGVLFILVILGVLLALRSRSPEEAAITTSDSETALMPTQESVSLRTNLEEILKRGGSSTCEFSTVDESNVSTTGTLFITDEGNRVRGEFDTTLENGETYRSNLLRNGNTAYFWSSLAEQGFQMTIEDPETFLESLQGSDDSSAWMDENYEMDFDCRLWNVDESVFVLPPNVTFVDMTSTLQQLNDMTNDLSDMSDQCAVCGLLPDESAKAECLSRLDC